MDFQEILQRYAEAEPRRARGGLAALAGFDFQLRAYLADFVTELANPRQLKQAGDDLANRLEQLSDYSRRSAHGQTVVVQAKRTLTASVMRQAATEFARIDLFFARQATGGAAYRPVYELVAQGGTALEWPDLPAGAESQSQSLAERFRLLREEKRLLPPRIEPDPWWRLIAAAYPVLDDPFAFAREALDACLAIGLEGGGGQGLRERIAELFARRRQETKLPGKALGPPDVAEMPATREVVVGQIPSFKHLRDGRFMKRPEHLAAALAAFDRLAAERDGSGGDTLPIFWIEGRSGGGKSVILLQLLRELVESRGWPAIWLANSGDLAPLVAQWPPSTQDLPMVVAIDDLYDRQNRQDLDLRKLAETLREEEAEAWPLVLTCGPPEFREALERDSRGEGLEVTAWKLPPMNEAEAQKVRAWYRQRTGKTPQKAGPRPPGWEAEPLMVSLLFEMHHGDLRPFARRFAERFNLVELGDALLLPLALNRLYLWSPADWLGTEGRDRLDHLNQDDDFRLLQTETPREGFLRLTHPHLSDQLYQALRPNPSAQAYARDLGSAFAKALETKPALAWRLLQACAEGGERLEIVDRPELARRVAAAWREKFAESRIPAAARPAVFTSLALWAVCEPEVIHAFRQDFLGRAIAGLEDQPGIRNWGLLYRLLHRAAPGDVRLRRAALAWVGNATPLRQREPDWSFTWQQLYQEAEAEERQALATAGWQWLQINQDLGDWNFVWQALAVEDCTGSKLLEGLLELGFAWAQDKNRQGWAFVWQRLADLQHLVGAPLRGSLTGLGQAWLEGREERSEWNYVWQRMLEIPGIREDPDALARLLEAGRVWLEGREERSDWYYVWKRLLEMPGIREDPDASARLLEAGRDWLEGREERSEWSHVWERLLEMPGIREDPDASARLLEAGRDWLHGREERSAWSHVWERLLEMPGIREDPDASARLLEAGRDWLHGREERSDWSHVWERLLEMPGIREDPDALARLLEAGRDWLNGREERSDWSHVWERLFERRNSHGLDAHEIGASMAAWLRAPHHRDRGEWDKFFEKLVDAGLVDGDLVPLGADWCSANRELPQTAPLAAKILAHSVDSLQLAPLAEWLDQWLELNPKARQAGAVRAVLRKPLSAAGSRVGSWSRLAEKVVALDNEYRQALLDLEAARVGGESVQGRIEAQVKGGFTVRLGTVKAFQPGSLLGGKPDDSWLGWQGPFDIQKVDFERSNVVVRLRAAIALDYEHRQALLDLEAARVGGESVQGRIEEQVKGGFTVQLGTIKAFLPGSLLGGKPYRSWLGWQGPFEVENVDFERSNVVVRRRAAAGEVQEKQAARVATLGLGERLRGVVTNIVDYGLFVDLGGLTGLLHCRSIGAEKGTLHFHFRIGQEIEVLVLAIDPERSRVSLGLAGLTSDGVLA
jgi:DNA-directed RNA polymerase subunit E'/Rpb7